MRRALLIATWMLLGAASQAADEIEPLEGDFLDYLANMEGDDDNWTLVDDPDRQPAPKNAESEQPTDKSAAPKANKEAAKPAVEER